MTSTWAVKTAAPAEVATAIRSTKTRHEEIARRFAVVGMTLADMRTSEPYGGETRKGYRLRLLAPGDPQTYDFTLHGLEQLDRFTAPEVLAYIAYTLRHAAFQRALDVSGLVDEENKARQEYGECAGRSAAVGFGYAAGTSDSYKPETLDRDLKRATTRLEVACKALVAANATIKTTLGDWPAQPYPYSHSATYDHNRLNSELSHVLRHH